MSEGSLADKPGYHQILLGIKSLLTKKISSLHCQGGERHALLDPEMSLNFPATVLSAVITVVSRLCWHNRDKPNKWSPACFCCRGINICKVQIPVCRSVLSVGKAVPDMPLGKGLESKPAGSYGWICTNRGYGCHNWSGRKGLSRGSCKAASPFS